MQRAIPVACGTDRTGCCAPGSDGTGVCVSAVSTENGIECYCDASCKFSNDCCSNVDLCLGPPATIAPTAPTASRAPTPAGTREPTSGEAPITTKEPTLAPEPTAPTPVGYLSNAPTAQPTVPAFCNPDETFAVTRCVQSSCFTEISKWGAVNNAQNTAHLAAAVCPDGCTSDMRTWCHQNFLACNNDFVASACTNLNGQTVFFRKDRSATGGSDGAAGTARRDRGRRGL